ncbi:UTRA domain-containing protein [Salibaculum griseiflavum]|uniref:GntR family transcriptional regulator n=1 Tax=Salibaculum griseiflavum TaxID=1914409 RepID=A0A2V1P7M7_9RHOB|nr:UTRA domain-containing protein [Salibaculum griseiflavum]PWG17808.1 GntR family transcriptional regulator [Salibaculum griseiflavum]
MSKLETKTWQGVRAEVQRRIRSRAWKPGDAIPFEADLAREFGCARATVNRALRDLAEAGLLERKRRSGTRVALHPTGRAVLDIPLIRKEVEAAGQAYGYELLSKALDAAPPHVVAGMERSDAAHLVHVVALHRADERPHVLEDRWIDPASVPDAATADFSTKSPNEWLLENVPFTRSELAIRALPADPDTAGSLDVAEGTAILTLDRATWLEGRPVTFVRLLHGADHVIRSSVTA